MPHSIRMFTRLLAVAALGAIASPCYADTFMDDMGPRSDGSRAWGLGLGAEYAASPYRADTTSRTKALPVFYYNSDTLHWLGTTLDYKLPVAGPLSFTLRAEYGLGDAYKASDSPYFQGMPNRNGSLWLGGTATWRNPVANMRLEFLNATGQSKGERVEWRVEHRFHLDRLSITPHLATTWDSSKYVDYYYGVTATEATAVRPLYAGKATTEIEGGVSMLYHFDRHNSVYLDVAERHRGSGITNSPLVDRTSNPVATIAYLYMF